MDSVGQKARSSSGRQPACRTCASPALLDPPADRRFRRRLNLTLTAFVCTSDRPEAQGTLRRTQGVHGVPQEGGVGGSPPSRAVRVCVGCCAGRSQRCVRFPAFPPSYSTISAIATRRSPIAPRPRQIHADDGMGGLSDGSIAGSASASSSSSADFSTRNCAARASASGLAGSSSEAQLARFGGGTGRPLQKGLACLACTFRLCRGMLLLTGSSVGKARRVRCDSARPACSSCRKTSKFKTGELQCVYRADLYLQRRKEEEAKRRLAGTVPMKEEDEDMPAAGEKVEPKEAARPAVQPVVKTEPGAYYLPLEGAATCGLTLSSDRPERGHPLRLAYLDQPTFSASALTDTTASAILRSACRHRRQKRVAVADFRDSAIHLRTRPFTRRLLHHFDSATIRLHLLPIRLVD